MREDRIKAALAWQLRYHNGKLVWISQTVSTLLYWIPAFVSGTWLANLLTDLKRCPLLYTRVSYKCAYWLQSVCVSVGWARHRYTIVIVYGVSVFPVPAGQKCAHCMYGVERSCMLLYSGYIITKYGGHRRSVAGWCDFVKLCKLKF